MTAPNRDSEQGVVVRLEMSRAEAEWLAEEAHQEGIGISEEDWTGLRDRLAAALTQQHSGRIGREVGLPSELARALSDPTIIIDRDREITLKDGRTLAEHLEDWRNAPSNTVGALPVAEQRVLVSNDAVSLQVPAPDCSGDDQQEAEAEVRAVERIAEELVSREQLFNEEGEMLEHHWPMVEDLAWSLFRAAGNPQQDDQQAGAEAERREKAERAGQNWLKRYEAAAVSLSGLLAAIARCKNTCGHMDQDMSTLSFDRNGMQAFNDLYALADKVPHLQAPDPQPVEGDEEAGAEVRAVERIAEELVSREQLFNEEGEMLPAPPSQVGQGRLESWIGEDGETYSELNQRERALLDGAVQSEKRLSGLLEKLEAEEKWLRTPGHVIGEHAMADRLKRIIDSERKP